MHIFFLDIQTKVKQKILDAVQNPCYTHLFSLVLLSYMVIVYSVEIIKDVIEYHDIVILYIAWAEYLQIKILFSIAKIKISLVINFLAYYYSPSNKLETNNWFSLLRMSLYVKKIFCSLNDKLFLVFLAFQLDSVVTVMLTGQAYM